MNRSIFLLAPLLAAASACATVSPHDVATRHEQRGDWAQAVRAYGAILDRDPDDKRAREGYRRAADAYLAERTELVEGALAQGEFEAALEIADETTRVAPDHPGAMPLLERTAQRAQDAAVQAARVDRYERAVRLNEALAIHAPELSPSLADELPKLRARWLDYTINRAAMAEQEGRSATAMLLWAKAHELSGDAAHLERSRATRERAVREEAWRVQLVLSPQQLGRLMERIDWPEGADVALVAQPTSGALVAQARLGAPTCQNESQQLQRVARVQVGTQRAANADYEREAAEVQTAQDRVWAAERELGRARRDREHAWRAAQGQPQGSSAWYEHDRASRRVASAERDLGWAEERLISERADLSRHQPYVLVPVYQDQAYSVTHVTRRCVSRLEISVGAQAPSAHELSITSEDETHMSYPALGLGQDPLRLRPDAELAEELELGAAKQIEARLIDGFRAHRQGVLARAQSASSDPQRLEAALRYALLAPEALSADLLRSIQEQSGVENVAHLLVRR